MTMSEFETILKRIDGVSEKLEILARQFAVHASVEDANGKRRGRWADRIWTLAVCVAGGILGFWLRK